MIDTTGAAPRVVLRFLHDEPLTIGLDPAGSGAEARLALAGDPSACRRLYGRFEALISGIIALELIGAADRSIRIVRGVVSDPAGATENDRDRRADGDDRATDQPEA